MAALLFDKCCCCIDLKSGCFIIGYLDLVFTLIAIIEAAINGIVGSVLTNYDESDIHNIGVAVVVVSGISFVALLLGLVFIIVLLVGLHKEKPGHLKAYLVFSLIQLVVLVINVLVVCFTNKDRLDDIVRNLICILLSIYFILVIRSMYFQMKDPSRGKAIFSAA